MKKFFIFFLILLFSCSRLLSQSMIANNNPYATSFFVELAGPGIASVNYDMRFNNSGEGLGFRAGIGGVPSSGISLLTLPVGLNYILSKDNKNYFEIGIGATFISARESSMNDNIFNGTFGHTTFGYRLQPKAGGFTFRAALNPVFSGEGMFPFYGGIGFGWKF